MLRSIVLMLFAPAVAVAAPVPKALKNKNSADGVWEVSKWHSRGNKVAASSYVMRWTINGEKLTIERTSTNPNVVVRPPRNPPAYTLVQADKADPKAIDYAITYSGGDRVVTYPGRLEVDGDTLKFCYAVTGGSRPTECEPGESNICYEFKRVKPADK